APSVQPKIKIGYAIITPNENLCCAETMLTFAATNGAAVQARADLSPAPLTTDASLSVDLIPARNQNLGLPIVNPGPSASSVTLGLRDSVDAPITNSVVLLQPGQQIARFVTEFFSVIPIAGFRGTIRLQASAPVSVMGLRFSGPTFAAVTLTSSSTALGGI